MEADGTVLGFFDREAPTEQDAVISAIVDVERAGIGARVLRVQADDDWLSASEIAERVGRSRQSVALLARSERGPGDFPAPAARQGSSNPLWSWFEVEAWFERYEPDAVPAHGPRLSPDFLAEVNDRLDLRERLRHSPHAPWRPKLNEALGA
ncbi:MAG: helix-turn-helix transcriptional regulator [Pseudonocardiaceae bacterium]